MKRMPYGTSRTTGLEPIDETDANAKEHDIDFDRQFISGANGVISPASTKANKAYIRRANRTIEKYKKGQKDDITGKPVTKKTYEAAKLGKTVFTLIEAVKGDAKEDKPMDEQKAEDYINSHSDNELFGN